MMTTFTISIGVALVLLAAILFADCTGKKRFNDRIHPDQDFVRDLDCG
ncbi:hypothetical protein [Novipirellula sp.]